MKTLAVDSIVSRVATSEDPNFPVLMTADMHPKRKYKASPGNSSSLISLGVVGGCSDIMLAGTNAVTASITVTDPNYITWGEDWGNFYVKNNRFKTLGGTHADVFASWTEGATGAAEITSEIVDVPPGIGYASKFTVPASENCFLSDPSFGMPVLAGVAYLLRVWAKSTLSNGISVRITITNGITPLYLSADGLSWSSSLVLSALSGLSATWAQVSVRLPPIPSGYYQISQVIVSRTLNAGAQTHIFTALEIGSEGPTIINDSGSTIIAALFAADTWGNADTWANNVNFFISASVLQRGASNALWLELSPPCMVPCQVDMETSTQAAATLEVGVIRAGLATQTAASPQFGMAEDRVDYSIVDENSNGSFYLKKRDIVRKFTCDLMTTRAEARAIASNFDKLGMEPTAWRLTDSTDSEWIVFARISSAPQLKHEHPNYSSVSFELTEVI